MMRRRLGRSEIEVSALGLGCMKRVFAQGEHCTAIQHNLNVLMDASEQLAVCDRFDQASIARGIARDILMRDGRTLPQGALAWVWARSDRSVSIPGFRTFEQVKENIEACDYGPLTQEQMEQIDILLE